MLAFHSIFKDELGEHLALKQKTTTKESCKQTRRILHDFDRHLVQSGLSEKVVSETTVNGWIRTLSAKNAKRTVSDKVSCVRKFLEYLGYCGFPAFIPISPKYGNDYVPYIFSDEDVVEIFKAADNPDIRKEHPGACHTRYAFPMLLRLLYSCGLRLGETLALRMRDINFADGTLRIIHAKNNKQRIVPMQKELTEMLRRYCAAMRIIGKPEAFLFPEDKPQQPLTQGAVRYVFKKTLIKSGVYIPPETPNKRNQCLHCFRHLFAIKSFAQAESAGRAVHESVPFLSVYLGHFDMDGTEKYLKFGADMFPEHADMFEAYAEGVFPEVRHEE